MSREAVCVNCAGQRWVCENHDDQPWEGSSSCCCGGAGAPCKVCNDCGPGQFPALHPGAKIIATVFSDGETLH